MTKQELITKLAEKTGQTKVLCETMISELSAIILEQVLMNKDHVPFGTMGQFKYKKSAARQCKLITTGEIKEIPEKGSANFVLSQSAKSSLAKVL